MTWREYLEKQIEAGATPEMAEMSVGRMMDLYESCDWNDQVPESLMKKEVKA